ncbi:RiPP maturation radical SAM C-methyltransferase, partial [Rhodopirellula baltica]|uniref:RiPP maturation radical SAM C-methyltransferase n=1 Tax=Rhodopirellula baltica TaxID=265606 RepID=UPI00055B60B5
MPTLLKTQTNNCETPEVVFAILPFCQLGPALDASTLATILKKDGISTKVHYFNRLFAGQVGGTFYDAAAASVSLNTLLGDWVFRDHVFGAMDDRSYLKALLDHDYLSVDLIPAARRAKEAVEIFLDTCLGIVDWKNVKVLCLIETFAKRDAVSGQLMSSLAIAKKLKKTFPHMVIILAGPSTEKEMGQSLMVLPFLDFICTADVYASIPAIVKDALEGRMPFNDLQARGIATEQRDAAEGRVLQLPIPDFDDYFELKGDGLPGCFDSIPMETSKGCWWAERNHCGFCALPGSHVRFRSKAPAAALLEFQVQLERYQPARIEMNDLIIDQRYFAELFPAMQKMRNSVEIFYETKAHLNRGHLELLADAGVTRIQAGIESLSTNSLKRMSKGVSASRNVQFLNDCQELGISCYWNYLHSFPGETASDMLDAIPVINSITGVSPPSTFQPVRLERFSPYFMNPECYGLDSIRPDWSYDLVYGGSGIDLDSL